LGTKTSSHIICKDVKIKIYKTIILPVILYGCEIWSLISRQESAVIAQLVWRWATGWTIGVLGFDSRRGLGIFLFTTASRTALGPTQPPIQRPGVKLTTHHLSPRSKNAWSCTSTPQYALIAWCLVKHRDNFTFFIKRGT
jgi:hypothetical protein